MTTHEARVSEALKPHSWHVKTNADGSLHGVCLGCFENGVLPKFDTWHEFAEHLAAVIAALPDIAIVTVTICPDCDLAMTTVVGPGDLMTVKCAQCGEGYNTHPAAGGGL